MGAQDDGFGEPNRNGHPEDLVHALSPWRGVWDDVGVYGGPDAQGESNSTTCEQADGAASLGFPLESRLGVCAVRDVDGKYGRGQKQEDCDGMKHFNGGAASVGLYSW